MRARRGAPIQRYETPATEFELHRISATEAAPEAVTLTVEGTPAIVLAVGGAVELREEGDAVRIASGESAYISDETPSTGRSRSAGPHTAAIHRRSRDASVFVASRPGTVAVRTG